jgi:hypothetical protein
MKHYWHEAAFIPDLADPVVAWKVAARFRELRDDGQVSDRPSTTAPDAFISAVIAC